jgi:hypothetical protein
VADLRIAFVDEPKRPSLRWITTRSVLRPGPDDGFAFGTPFAVQGRSSRELICEFGEDPATWTPAPATATRLRLEVQLSPSEKWSELVAFDWWSPPSDELMNRYLAHRNERIGGPVIAEPTT